VYHYKNSYRLGHVESSYYDHTKAFVEHLLARCPEAEVRVISTGTNKTDDTIIDLILSSTTLRLTSLHQNGGERVENGPYAGWFVSTSQAIEILKTGRLAIHPDPQKRDSNE